MTSPSSGASIPIPIVANTTTPKFTVPMPSLNAALNQRIEVSIRNSGLAGYGNGGGTGDGTGSSNGTGTGSGDMADICGLKIATREKIVVIEDEWKAWHSTGDTAAKVQDYADRCIAKFFFGNAPIQVNGDLTYYDPKNPRVHSDGDLYKAAYPMENAGPDGQAPTAMLIISTWVNVGESAHLLPEDEILREQATETFVDSLREHHIKLYVLSTKLPPYHVLSDYAKESGGQVSVTPELDLSKK
jgi:hypothetical protein